MPRLWDETIEAHRRAVHDKVVHTAAALAAEHGLRAVTMSQVAEAAGIGRATLYKYFPDVEAILLAWHRGQVAAHLEQLTAVRDRAGDAGAGLAAVLEAYALVAYESWDLHRGEVAAFLHRGEHVAEARRRLHDLVRDLLAEAAGRGELRDDIAPGELATYCLHALAAAAALPSRAAVRRLVTVTGDGLRPAPAPTTLEGSP